MFSTLKKAIGYIDVEQKGNQIVIQGLPTRMYLDTIYALWHTSKIENYMFSRVSNSAIAFHQFFLPDVVYTLEQAIANPKRSYGNYRALQRVVELLKEQTWFAKTLVKQPSILDRSALSQLSWKLLEHQDTFLDQYDDLVPRYGLKGYMLAASPGAGKTLMGYAWSLCLHADTTILIVPKNAVVDVWEYTINAAFKDKVDYWSSLSGEPLVAGKRYYIAHYEQIDRLATFFTSRSSKLGKVAVVIDESHNFNEADSLRTTLLVDLCTKVFPGSSALWMSGTPIKAIGNEAIPFLSTIDPLFDRFAEERFRGIYGKSATRALDVLRNRIGNLTFKIDRATVITNPKEFFKRDVVIPNGKQYTLNAIKEEMRAFVTQRMTYYRQHFDAFLDQYNAGCEAHAKLIRGKKEQEAAFAKYQDYIKMIRKGYDPVLMKTESMYCNHYELKIIVPFLPQKLKEEFKNARSVVKYVDLKVRGEALGRILGKRRAQCHVDMVEHCDLEPMIDGARKKTVIFTSYVEVVDKTYDYLVSLGYKPLRVYGETNKDLPLITARFKNDVDANPLIATYQSLSTAVPLVMASNAIMMNSPFRPHELDQARARVDRLGQDGSVSFYDLFLKTEGDDNISTRSGDIMEFCREQVDAILGIHNDDMTETVDSLGMESMQDLMDESVATLLRVAVPLTPAYLNW